MKTNTQILRSSIIEGSSLLVYRVCSDNPLGVSVKEGHEMVYQRFNVTEQGLLMTGIVGSWYCDETARVYIFNYVTLPEFATQQDLLREFQRHIDFLACH
jgi:hypothetical protein